VSRDGGPLVGDQQAECVVQMAKDLLGREQCDASGGELDGKRNTVQPNANAGNRRGIAVVE
jgi:hypothetical protein